VWLDVLAECARDARDEFERAACLADRREGRAMVASRVGGVEDGERAGLERPYLRYKVVGVGQLGRVASASHLRWQVGDSMPPQCGFRQSELRRYASVRGARDDRYVDRVTVGVRAGGARLRQAHALRAGAGPFTENSG
jgi:hypothetical protein